MVINCLGYYDLPLLLLHALNHYQYRRICSMTLLIHNLSVVSSVTRQEMTLKMQREDGMLRVAVSIKNQSSYPDSTGYFLGAGRNLIPDVHTTEFALVLVNAVMNSRTCDRPSAKQEHKNQT
jgi:hypothetical protein